MTICSPENRHSCSATFMRDFLQKVLDVDHYPMVLRDTIIVEPYIDAPAKACVEGCVYNKEILHWAISDSLHWPGQDIPFQGSYMPSTLSDQADRGECPDVGESERHVRGLPVETGAATGAPRAVLRGPSRPPFTHGPDRSQPASPSPQQPEGKVRDMVNTLEAEILKEDSDVKIIWMMSFDDEFLHGKMEFAKLWTYGKTPDDAKKKCREVTQRLVKKPEQLKFNFP
uniref:Uncharacterized protein n=1 Tax=Branchiostoma floridae TaxID=7739 RepID=C3ZQF2_BRAFL|eukprot:XP_002589197.1 hypothetical protein BRAFLDRAFT_74645 [Branchiostoma floridae]